MGGYQPLIVVVLILSSCRCALLQDKRQAIPLAVAQSGVLHGFSGGKDKQTPNSTIPTNLGTMLQNYAQVIKEQAERDIKQRNKGSALNITESLYNSSIAFAIDNNKTSAIQNNTIHLLQNMTSKEPTVQHEPVVSLTDVSNKTILDRTITIPKNNLTNQPEEGNTYTEITNKINKTLTINTNNNSANYTPSNIRKDRMGGETLNFRHIVDQKSRLRFGLPHFTNIYYINKFSHKLSSSFRVPEDDDDDHPEESETHGILVGPLDNFPDHPNGNGPQDKKLKDLGGTGLNSDKKGKKNERLKSKKKKQMNHKSRSKRQLYGNNFRDPWAYSMDSAPFENNNIPEPLLRSRSYTPPSTDVLLKAYVERARNAAYRRNMWQLQQQNKQPNPLNNRMESAKYNRMLDRYALGFEQNPNIPAIGGGELTRMMHRSLRARNHQALIPDSDDPMINNQPKFYPQNSVNEGPSEYDQLGPSNAREYHNFNSEGFSVDTNSLEPSMARNPAQAGGMRGQDRMSRDRIIEEFLNRYDEQTKLLAGLYKQIQSEARSSFHRPEFEQRKENLQDPGEEFNFARNPPYRRPPVAYDRTLLQNVQAPPSFHDVPPRRPLLPYELDAKARPSPSFPSRYGVDPTLAQDYMRSYAYQNNLPQDPVQNELLSQLIKNPYKRTMQPAPAASQIEQNLVRLNYQYPLQPPVANTMVSNVQQPQAEQTPEKQMAKQRNVVMLMVTTPVIMEDEARETIKHRELTRDGITRASSNITEAEDFSINLKKAADFVLSSAVADGNITINQRKAIEGKLDNILERNYKNKSRGEIRGTITRAEIPNACEDTISDCEQFKTGGVCPFMTNFMKGTCAKTCQACGYQAESKEQLKISKFFKQAEEPVETTRSDIIEPLPHRLVIRQTQVPEDPVMYLTFEHASKDGVVEDSSGNRNNALLEKGAGLSPRILGTCGKAAELNEGSVTWSGEEFKRKPDTAISIGMYVKVKKSGVINWFANGQTGDRMFYTKSRGAVVPAKVWTHVAGTYDSTSGLARIYINGELEQEQTQRKGEKLSQSWLVNGIGAGFGDDSLHYADEVVVYDRPLSQADVRMLFNRCTFNRMVLHFGFQKGNKTIIADQSGLGNNAILIGGAHQKEECDRCGYCLDLSKGPDPTMKIERITVKKLPRTEVSIAVWMSLNTTNGVHNIFTTESNEGNIGYRLQVVNGRVRWAIGTDTVPVIFDHMTDEQVVPESLWTHVVCTYNTETGVVRIFLNSQQKLSEVVSEDRREFLPTNWDNDASIGDHTLRGYLDEFIMYNWDLDASEALYVRNYCADHPKLVRFTVHVPLTKKSDISRVSPDRKRGFFNNNYAKKSQISRISAHRKRRFDGKELAFKNTFNRLQRERKRSSIVKNTNWWSLYSKLANDKMKIKRPI